MATFHDDKLWQEGYTAVLDLCEIAEGNDVLEQAKALGLEALTTLADAASRRDRREHDIKLRDVMGQIAGIRSLLSVAWAQEALDDEVFQKLDTAYESLGTKLPR